MVKFHELMQTGAFEKYAEVAKPFYKVMAEDIVRQQTRLGGTFAVAHAVARRESREYLRTIIGPDLVFIVLNLTMDCNKERLAARHGGTLDVEEMAAAWLPIYEPAGSDEEDRHAERAIIHEVGRCWGSVWGCNAVSTMRGTGG